MLPEERFITLLNISRPLITRSYIRFNKQEAGSKFSSDEVEVVSDRINQLLDQFISTLEHNDNSIFLRYAQQVTEIRLAAGYKPDAIIRLWDWGLTFFIQLIENNLALDPDKLSYIRRVQAVLNIAKLVVANATLSQISNDLT